MRNANVFDLLLLYFGFLKRVCVEGNSMLPTLKNGDEILVKSSKSFQIGDIILANHPYKTTKIIKRIVEFSTGGKLFLRGDNPQEKIGRAHV